MIVHGGLIARRQQGLWRGVLIQGASGVGKSDLALRALDLGFRLVADDRVLLWVAQGRLFGRAPEVLSGLMEVRGQGLVAIEPVRFCEVVLAVTLGTPDRMPDPATLNVMGVALPRVLVDPFEISAPAKLGRAMEAFAAPHKRGI